MKSLIREEITYSVGHEFTYKLNVRLFTWHSPLSFLSVSQLFQAAIKDTIASGQNSNSNSHHHGNRVFPFSWDAWGSSLLVLCLNAADLLTWYQFLASPLQHIFVQVLILGHSILVPRPHLPFKWQKAGWGLGMRLRPLQMTHVKADNCPIQWNTNGKCECVRQVQDVDIPMQLVFFHMNLYIHWAYNEIHRMAIDHSAAC